MSEAIRVLIELRNSPKKRHLATFDVGYSLPDFLSNIPGFSLDQNYQPVVVQESKRKTTATFSLAPEPENYTYAVRGQVENQIALEQLIKKLGSKPDVIGVFSDPRISLFGCPSPSKSIGNYKKVEELLQISELHRRGMDGSDVMMAMVDTGINLKYLKKKGRRPNFDRHNSWDFSETIFPGSAPISHGTMCAFDACIAAPNCTLLDYPVIFPIDEGLPTIEHWLSDVFPVYNRLKSLILNSATQKTRLVINNSWGMHYPDWDYPVGDKNNYSDNPEHPFNKLVSTLEKFGADILFAAGNCGEECPDRRCETRSNGITEATRGTIYGANSHPKVLSIGAVTVKKKRLDYSNKGPGRLEDKKPDLCAYSHFKGSKVYSRADCGTSAACAVAAGVVAAIRSIYPPSALPPAQLREILRTTAEKLPTTAEKLSPNDFDYSYGFGLINVSAILNVLDGLNISQR
jgi:hypothetical protein